jgi:hypothetical protein
MTNEAAKRLAIDKITQDSSLLYIIEVLKDRYEYEQFRKNNFDSVIGIPITVLSLLIGGLAAFAFREKEIHSWVRIGSLIGMAPIAMSMFHLVRVFFGLKRKYDVLPNGTVIRGQYQRLAKYHDAKDDVSPPEVREHRTIVSFQEDLAEWYTNCNLINCKINDLRAEHFHSAKLWLIISISVIFILLILQIFLDL